MTSVLHSRGCLITLSYMKTTLLIIVLVAMVALCPKFVNAQSGVSAGVRQHVLHSVFEELPFEDGDLTYTLGYEYHDKNGYWQLLVGYTPDLSNEELGIDDIAVDYVITPQLNLIFQDGVFLAGTGILGSYIETEEEGDWTDIYWQLMLGLEIPLGALSLEAMAYYPFESWGDIDDFDFDDVEYGGSIKYRF